jgi:short-subunit dehydrogenase involved in D-alanine esterification of teichoic acids
MTCMLPEAVLIMFSVIAEEFNTNYIAPVTLFTYFVPHFLKLSVCALVRGPRQPI